MRAATSALRVSWADALMFGVALIWGTSFSIMKVVLDQIPPFVFNALRFPLAIGLLGIAWYLQDTSVKRLVKPDIGALAVIGVVGYVGYQIFFVSGLARTTASNSSLILATIPVFVALINALLRTERLGGMAWIGVLLSIVGIGLIVTGSGGVISLGIATVRGDLLIVGAAAAWATYTVAVAPYLARHAALGVTVVSLGAATVVLVLLGLPQFWAVEWARLPLLVWGGILYTGLLGVAGAYLLWNIGVKRLGGTRAAVYSNLVPFIAVATAAFTLHEEITRLHVAGGAVILLGISLTRRHRYQLRAELTEASV